MISYRFAKAALVGLAVLLVSASATAQESAAPTAREIAARAAPTVVLIRAFRGEEPVSLGSGFFIRSDGVVASNLHVVDDADRLEVKLPTGETYGRVYVLSYDRRRDLVLLRVPATDAPTLPQGDDRDLGVGDPVYAIGHPLGLEGTFSDGIVSAKRTIDGVAYLQITAPISSGSSGGPILNRAGEVVAIATQQAPDGQNLNLAVPVRYASGLLALEETPRPFADVAAEWAPTEEAERAGVRANTDTRTAYGELERWEREVVDQLVQINVFADSVGYAVSDHSGAGALDEGERAVRSFRLAPGQWLAAAVCDNDCPDLDLFAYDASGELLDSDQQADAFPFVLFSVSRSATYSLSVSMYSCTVEPCTWAVQLYRRR